MLSLRSSTDADIPAITAIYAHHVTHGTGTFETTAPSESDMAARRADVLAKDGEEKLRVAQDRLTYWRGVGAQASPTVERLLKDSAAQAPAQAAA